MFISWLFYWLELTPLLCLCILAFFGKDRDIIWWLLACVFAVSWLADTCTLYKIADQWVISLVYPILQASIVGVALLEQRETNQLLWVLMASSVIVGTWHDVFGPDILLRTVCWGSIAGITWSRTSKKLAASFLISFGGGLLCWFVLIFFQNLHAGLVYKTVFTAGLIYFCSLLYLHKPDASLNSSLTTSYDR